MGSENPDRTLIGELMIQLEGLEREVQGFAALAVADMIEVLTEDQVEKLASIALTEALRGDSGGDRGRLRHSGNRPVPGGGDRP